MARLFELVIGEHEGPRFTGWKKVGHAVEDEQTGLIATLTTALPAGTSILVRLAALAKYADKKRK